MSEYTNFVTKYPNISFNDNSSKRNKNHYLLSFETKSIHPSNYDISVCKQYKGVITWNSKFYDLLKDNSINAIKINGFPLMDNYNELKEFVTYENKINGITLIARIRQGFNLNGDIVNKRTEVMSTINVPIKHVYGMKPWGDSMYKGPIGKVGTSETYPSSIQKFQVMNKYKYNLCFENCYHDIWSWDYITEKIFDCFKSKTIPVYLGCYNIEKYIPKDLYIDYRDFKNTQDLSNYLLSLPEKQYIDMTENAYSFDKNNRMGSIKDFENVIRGLS